jgi:alkyl sulfatase BDS1-like metallo-beta-lactamase superfamily hydrolase
MNIIRTFIIAGLTSVVLPVLPVLAVTEAKPAIKYTIESNEKVLQSLPFTDKQDFEDATRGLITKSDVLTITDKDGKAVWDLETYK